MVCSNCNLNLSSSGSLGIVLGYELYHLIYPKCGRNTLISEKPFKEPQS